MALPKIKHPTYKATIPSTKKEVTLRPFTVQEEKILLMAKSTEKTADIVSAVKQIIQNCVQESIDIEKLATFDIEYLFIRLRAKSVGEIVDLEYTDPDTKEVIRFKLNLDDVQVKFNDGHTNKIKIMDDVGIAMRYPTLEELKSIEEGGDEEKTVTTVLKRCIDKIYDKDNVYTDYTDQELDEFINSLPLESMTSIKEFFDTMPSLEHTVELKNKAGETKKIVLKGINSFFT
jgi:hypothetical protein